MLALPFRHDPRQASFLVWHSPVQQAGLLRVVPCRKALTQNLRPWCSQSVSVNTDTDEYRIHGTVDGVTN